MEVPKQEEPLVEKPLENLEELKPEETPKPVETEKQTRWDGLSKEELLKVVNDQDSHIGVRNQEIGELRGKMTELEKAQQRYAQDYGNYSQQQPEVTPPQPEEKPPDFNWDKPSQSVEETVKRVVAKEREGFVQGQFNQNLQRAKTAFQRGKQVMTEDPIFKGIEKEVEDQVGQFYYPYLQQGIPVDQYITDKQMWLKTAQHIRLNRGEYDKLKPDTSSAVRPTMTETPSRIAIQEEGSPVLELEPKDRAFARGMGLTEKEAKEIIEAEIKEGRK